VNKRARNRLIVVTAFILFAVGGIIWGTQASGGGGAYYKTVAEASKDKTLVDKRVQVGGPVVTGSWDKKTNPMTFTISDKQDPKATIKVVYNGTVPTTFGDGTEAIVTGKLGADGTIAANTLITKCPSKYESGAGALTVAKLLSDKTLVGKPDAVSGFVAGPAKAAGSGERFLLTDKQGDTTTTLRIAYDGALPDGFKDGVRVVVRGSLGADSVYTATSVAIESK
jgi:cytochrome c-type biogenesis protein CcmE